MPDFINISTNSRYKDTIAYQGDRGVEYGLWAAPDEFNEQSTGDAEHIVAEDEVGFLDKLAVDYYGEGYEVYWWAIAQQNGIIDPEAEMFPGQILRIPARQRIVEFTARAGVLQ